jgi:hypothetical protein
MQRKPCQEPVAVSKNKRASPSRQQPPEFEPTEWATVYPTAFERILSLVGSPRLAAHTLYRELVEGQLPSMLRHLTLLEGDPVEGWTPLGLEFWQQSAIRLIVLALAEDREAWVRLMEGTGCYYFVDRGSLDKLYPMEPLGVSRPVTQPKALRNQNERPDTKGDGGRPKGTGYAQQDAPFVKEILELVAQGKAKSLTEAATQVVNKNETAVAGIGSVYAKVRRLTAAAQDARREAE